MGLRQVRGRERKKKNSLKKKKKKKVGGREGPKLGYKSVSAVRLWCRSISSDGKS